MTAKDAWDDLAKAFSGKHDSIISFHQNGYEAIKAERDEMLERLIHTSRTVCGSCAWSRGCCLFNKCPGLAKINVIIERATGMTIDEAIKAYEDGGE